MLEDNIIEVKGLVNELGGNLVHNNLNFNVIRGEICAIVGGSGVGKTTLLHSILKLLTPKDGTIYVLNKNISDCNQQQLKELKKRWGVLFQHGALFSSLYAMENICFPLQEFTELSYHTQCEIGFLRLAQVGLSSDTAWKYPSELSGGMLKRVALARALVLEPELIFLDEPTTGLDSKTAESLEELILYLHKNLNLTIVMITHDLDTLWRVPDRVAFLGDGQVLANMSMSDLVRYDHPAIKRYFSGRRNKLRYI